MLYERVMGGPWDAYRTQRYSPLPLWISENQKSMCPGHFAPFLWVSIIIYQFCLANSLQHIFWKQGMRQAAAFANTPVFLQLFFFNSEEAIGMPVLLLQEICALRTRLWWIWEIHSSKARTCMKTNLFDKQWFAPPFWSNTIICFSEMSGGSVGSQQPEWA